METGECGVWDVEQLKHEEICAHVAAICDCIQGLRDQIELLRNEIQLIEKTTVYKHPVYRRQS